MEYVTLTNGLKMPMVGFGVFRVPDKKECQESVYQAMGDYFSSWRAMEDAYKAVSYTHLIDTW